MKEQKSPKKKPSSPYPKRQPKEAPGGKGESEKEGIIYIGGKGEGFVKEYDGQPRDEAIEIDPTFLRTALHGDRVTVRLHSGRKGHQRSGEVTSIIARARKGYAGALESVNGIFFVVPSDRRMYANIAIAPDRLLGAKVGDKVFASIDTWESAHEPPIGSITHVLGRHGEHNAEMKAIALERGFESAFPEAVEGAARALEASWDASKEMGARRDFRDTPTCTIDPADAKDFDDALSFREVEHSVYEVGIHIADVSYFVKEGGTIDREAYDRATSVYLVDRTIPMLPEALSNDLCSLVEGKDRFVMSAVFTMNDSGDILSEWYGEGVIRSAKRFSYEEAQRVLDTGKGPFAQELATLNSIASSLRMRRKRDGALMIDAPEVKFTLDEKGVPTGVTVKVHHDTNHLIEEFMLLANKMVTEWVEKTFPKGKRVFVYRVHDKPDQGKMGDLAFFLGNLGYTVQPKGGVIPSRVLNGIIEKVAGTPLDETIDSIISRTMAKAVYTTRNIGHYGLSFRAYTHFTSPIRRYPDLMVHRLLKRYLSGKRADVDAIDDLESKCAHASAREREAQEAERASVKYKQVEYMESRVGQIFDGIITGVSEWGVYVSEKETRSEGLVRMRDIGDEYFELDEKHMRIIGKRSKKTYTMGDNVRIKVAGTNLMKKTIDYVFVS